MHGPIPRLDEISVSGRYYMDMVDHTIILTATNPPILGGYDALVGRIIDTHAYMVLVKDNAVISGHDA